MPSADNGSAPASVAAGSPFPCALACVGAAIEPSQSARQRPLAEDKGVTQMRYNAHMKSSTIPSVRVEPEFRAEIEAVLTEGETLSEFVETSVRVSVERRRIQAQFIDRGLRSRDGARLTGDYVDADVVLEDLQRKLDAALAHRQKLST